MKKYQALLEDDEIFFNFYKCLYDESYIRYRRIDEKIDLKELERLRNTNMTNTEIARHMGLKLSTMQKIVQDYGLPKRTTKNRKKKEGK